ncbi:hypothetical protein V8V91_17810 [Algoriphagus halophilus]|uniref:hypothetical protein n=1 Tax=Algoriphagus halophilus TaxID=226505 RepID=UPI0035900F9A
MDSQFSINTVNLEPTLASAYVNGLLAPVTQERGSDFSEVLFNVPVIGGGANRGKLNGELAELIVFPRSLTELERAQMHSYLAVKFGITLDPSINRYITFSGVEIWNNKQYWNDVFGIGRQQASDVYQESSNSINTGSGTGIGQDGKGNIVIQALAILDDDDFLMIGHDNGSLNPQATDLPSGLKMARVGREWKVKQTRFVGDIKLEFYTVGRNYPEVQIQAITGC